MSEIEIRSLNGHKLVDETARLEIEEIKINGTGGGVGQPGTGAGAEIFNDYTYNVASGECSHVEGMGNVAMQEAQHVQGKYNILNDSDELYAHIVGNGISQSYRSNAHTLDWSGNAWYSGDVYVGSTSGTNKDEGSKKLATEEYVAEEIANIGNTLALHPIGSIYMSVNETSPAELFGGTWEQLKNRFLLGTSDAHPLGETGGAKTHTLTESELPKISGTISLGNGAAGATAGGYGTVRTASGAFKCSVEMQYGRPSAATSVAYVTEGTSFRDAVMNFGGGQAHNNMPPYIAVNIWKRVA